MFHTILIKESLRKKATVTTERQTNAFLGIIMNVSLNLELISVYKSLDAIEKSSITKNFTSDNFIKNFTSNF